MLLPRPSRNRAIEQQVAREPNGTAPQEPLHVLSPDRRQRGPKALLIEVEWLHRTTDKRLT
jgi:hypothetical protein